jgi:hypothetical protein
MIDWLNDNSGAVQAVAVLALVLITAIYAGFTWRMVNELRRQRLAQDRPDLLIHVEVAGDWHEPRPDDEQSQAKPWLHTYPKNLDCHVYNAGRHAAKEVFVTIVHPGVLFKSPRKGFLVPGETWHTGVSADPILEYVSDRVPQGLSEWLAAEAEGRQESVGNSYDAGAVVLYCDIHDVPWATYLVLGLMEVRDETKGKVTDRYLLPGRQRITRLKHG